VKSRLFGVRNYHRQFRWLTWGREEMSDIFVTTVPFGEGDDKPLILLNNSGFMYSIDPFNKKLTEDELC